MLINKKKLIDIKSEVDYQKVYKKLDAYMKGPQFRNGYVNHPEVKENKTIWIFWQQGMENAPKLVMKCVESIMRNKPDDFDLVVITWENIDLYVEFPPFIWEKYKDGKISTTHLSDILRMELLYTYGGCWIDATVYCSDKIPRYMLERDLFLFRWTLLTNSVLKSSSWWICAKRGEPIIEEARNVLYKYWLKENKLINYFLLHIILSKIVDSNSFNKIKFYEMPYVCNSNPHALYVNLEAEYKEDKWNIIKENSKIHKLSYKKKYLQGDIYNFYLALIEGKLS